MLKPTAVVLTLLSVGRIFYGDFGMVYGIVGENPILVDAVNVIDTYVYRLGIQQAQFDVGAAVGLFKSAVSSVLVVLSYVLADKLAGYRIL